MRRRDALLKLKRLSLWTLTVSTMLSHTGLSPIQIQQSSCIKSVKMTIHNVIFFLIFGRAFDKNISTYIDQNFPNEKEKIDKRRTIKLDRSLDINSVSRLLDSPC